MTFSGADALLQYYLCVGSETGLILTAATLRTLPLKGLGWKSLLREQCPQTF